MAVNGISAHTFSVSNDGFWRLGTEQTLKVSTYADGTVDPSVTFTVTYECGFTSETVATESRDVYYKFTPPVSLASENPYGVTVPITYTVETFVDGISAGTVSRTYNYSIPDEVVPSLSVEFSQEEYDGYYPQFNGYLQNVSQIKVNITGIPAYDSEIVTYKTVIDGQTYLTNSFTTLPITSSGSVSVDVTVTDARSRSTTQRYFITVITYSKPAITKLTVHRCNEDGTENLHGQYAIVNYSYVIADISGQNGKTAQLKYKKSSDGYFTTVDLAPSYSVTDASYIFEAPDDGASYDVELVISDDVATTTKATSVSTAFSIMHFNASGAGLAIGKVSEKNAFEVGMAAEFDENVEAKKDLTVLGNAALASLTVGGVSLLDLFHPVGSIYQSTVETSPQELFGGTWVALSDVFLLASGTEAAGDTGGNRTHTLSESEMPSHYHFFDVQCVTSANGAHSHGIPNVGSGGSGYDVYAESWTGGSNMRNLYTETEWNHTHNVEYEGNTDATGGGNAFEIMPPYLAVYMWKRTA